jgi:branched-chain amino acid aminotransferase
MINFNGILQDSDTNLLDQNRGFLYGDGVFETLKIVGGKILFFEDHYFRLMAAMRIVRMEIPMNFTLEYLEEQVLSLVEKNKIEQSARARITVYRNNGGLYLPTNNTVSSYDFFGIGIPYDELLARRVHSIEFVYVER